jgi:tellurite methyltransferase
MNKQKENPEFNLLKESLKYIKSGSVLDLGAGDGHDSLFYSKLGFNVTAIDNSIQNINDINNLAKINNLKINPILEDIRNLRLKQKYDIILCNYVSHLLNKEETIRFIRKIKENTKKRGLNIITSFTNENPPIHYLSLFQKEELKELYKDFEILYYSEYCSPIKPHLTIKPESIVEIIARKI